LNAKEKHINRRAGTIFIPHPKEKTPKMIFLDSEDKELLNRFSEGLPDLNFFDMLQVYQELKQVKSSEINIFTNGGKRHATL